MKRGDFLDCSHLDEKKISGEQIFDGIVVKLYRDKVILEDGTEAVREVIKHPGGVCVLPLDGDGNIYMVKQFRYPFGRVLLEVPAGKKEPGEEPLECGLRELGEEIGAVAKNVTPLGKLYPTVAYDTETIWMYLAEELSFSGGQSLDPEEFIDVVKLPFDEAYAMVLRDEIPDAKTQLAIMKAREVLKSREGK